MHLSAYVRDRETNQHLIIERDYYDSKAAFREELGYNGYAVIRISDNRDLAVMDAGYSSFNALLRMRPFWNQNPDLWRDELAYIKSIYEIEL